eukprot:Clim_evm2s51 gene=Clim_evmTU2s51
MTVHSRQPVAPKSGETRVPVGVAAFITKQDDDGSELLLVGVRRGSHGKGTYALPGGWLEVGESFEDAAVRETLEETGLKVSAETMLAVANNAMPELHSVTVFMRCHRDDPSAEPANLEPHKCEGWEWISLTTMKAIANEPETHKVGIFPPLASLLSGSANLSVGTGL